MSVSKKPAAIRRQLKRIRQLCKAADGVRLAAQVLMKNCTELQLALEEESTTKARTRR